VKVSFIITNLSSGGAERVLSIVANYFAQQNIDVQIIAVQDNSIDYPIDKRIRYVYTERKLKKPFAIIERILDIRRHIKDSDVVISFLWHINVYTILATRFLNKKVIISDRSDPANEVINATKLQQLARDIFYYFPERIVFQMPGAKSYYSSKIQEKGLIIPNPISPYLPDPYTGIRRKEIVAVCRLAPQKNIKMTIDAFDLLYKDHPDYTLTIYGDGELREELEIYVEKLSLQGVISFPGFTKNVHEKIIDSAMYISSSDYEGISNSMLEALAIGLPSVVTDCPVGGAKMFVKNNENGILIPTGDTNALHEAMKRIIEDTGFAEKLSKNALKLREELSPAIICQRWLELL
jgi:glycosyltransferase involved in cell wall biosynthesis